MDRRTEILTPISHPAISRCDKNQHCGCRTGPIQTELYKHRRWLKAGNLGFRKYRNCTIRVAKTEALISFAVAAKLIHISYADCWFSHAAHLKYFFTI